MADFGPEPDPAPMTSIAWLAWHIGTLPSRLSEVDFLNGDHTIASGWTSPYLTHHPIFACAHHATTAFWEGWGALRAALAEASDDQLELTSPDYTYAHEPMSGGLCVLGPQASSVHRLSSLPGRSTRSLITRHRSAPSETSTHMLPATASARPSP